MKKLLIILVLTVGFAQDKQFVAEQIFDLASEMKAQMQLYNKGEVSGVVLSSEQKSALLSQYQDDVAEILGLLGSDAPQVIDSQFYVEFDEALTMSTNLSKKWYYKTEHKALLYKLQEIRGMLP